MSSNLVTKMATGALNSVLSTQTGLVALNFAPVVLKAPALAAVAAGGAAMGALEYYTDRTDTNASRHATAQFDEQTRFAEQAARFVRATQPRSSAFAFVGGVLRTGAGAALGSAALGLAGVTGVLPAALAFGAAALGLPLANLIFVLCLRGLQLGRPGAAESGA